MIWTMLSSGWSKFNDKAGIVQMLPAKWREGTRKLNVIKNIASVFWSLFALFCGQPIFTSDPASVLTRTTKIHHSANLKTRLYFAKMLCAKISFAAILTSVRREGFDQVSGSFKITGRQFFDEGAVSPSKRTVTILRAENYFVFFDIRITFVVVI